MPVSIRSRLLLLVLSALLPALLGMAWLIGSTFEAERNAYQRTLRDTTRALSMLVDRELARRQTIAHVLAQSRWLDGSVPLSSENVLNFERQALMALEGTEGWIELRAPGRKLLDTRRSPVSTAAADELAERPMLQPLAIGPGAPAAATGAAGGPDLDEPHAALVEPVSRDGRTVYNLVVTIRPAELQRIIDAQQLPPGWTGTVLDNQGQVVARRPGATRYIGRKGTPDLLARMAGSREGVFDSVSLDGMPATGYFSTSPLGWTYVSAMPREQFAGLVPRAVLHIVLGGGALLALSIAGALWLSRRIVAPVHALKAAAERMQAGEPVALQATGITECDEVAQALSEAAATMRDARADLERQVEAAVERTRVAEQRAAQSQRVEALGRLTGGVAHDFNNLLGVISNSAHLMQRQAAALPELQAPLAATLRSVEVGSQLTQHLLRFAGRRPLKPQRLELGRYLPEVQELMRSVLGRRVEITVDVAVDTHAVQVDAGELELALVNLALNARDAMPSGGELRVRARNADAADAENLPPGRYVLLTVSDDGQGIEASLAERVFEPFFTTKAVGQGTGLGLSQVHGFAVQSGGAARLDSTPGIGTTVSLLLPAAAGAAAPAVAAPPAPAAQRLAGLQVLLVEDNETLRDVTAALLQSHGARIVRAATAEEALQRLAAGTAVDLVLSDIVMPGALDGLGLARRLRQLHPRLPVLLTTGFSPTPGIEKEFVVLRKPCPEAALLAALGQVLRRPL